MFGRATFDLDDMMEQAAEASGHATVVEGSEKSDSELEASEGGRSTVIEGSGEPDDGAGAEDGDVIGAEDNTEGSGHLEDSSQGGANPWDPTRAVGTTLNPEQRAMAHQSKYEAEFVVELNMTEAHDTGERMGIVLNREADFMPATVWRIHKVGMVEDWNRAHPDKQVHVGDEIIRVNDVQWHANTETFISRIGGQFQSARSKAEGAKEILSLYVQRPRVWEHKAFLGQRWDAHVKDYPTEFIATIFLPDKLDDTMEKEMGWQLERQHGPMGLEEWKPIIIKYIDRLGPVEAWNRKNPDKLIIEGDEIIQLDNIKFRSNVTFWLKGLQKHYRSATVVRNTNRTALVYVRRPAKNQEEFDATHPFKDITTWKRPKHSLQLSFPETSSDPIQLLGWQVRYPESDNGTSAVVINWFRQNSSLTSKINAENPEAIARGDLIVEVNGFAWEMYDKASDFYAVVEAALKEAALKGPQAEPVNLVLERPTKLVRRVRQNMERGVHMDKKMLRHLRELRTTTTTPEGANWASDATPLAGADWRAKAKANAKAKGAGASDEDEATGASQDDDNDVIGASEDGEEDLSSGAKDATEETDDTP